MTRPRRRGIALVTVIWLGAILLVMVLSLAYATGLTVQTNGNWRDSIQAYYTATSGLEQALAQLDAEEPGTLLVTAEGLLLDSKDLSQNPEAESYRFVTRVLDNCGKLDLNTATAEQLALLPGMDEDLAAAIVDWRTPLTDDEGNPTTTADGSQVGAYDGFYQQQTPAYEAAHRPFQSVEELLLVQGMTPELLYGTSERPLRLTPTERFRMDLSQDFAPANPEDVPLIDLVTVAADSRDLASDLEPRLEFTTTNLDALRERADALGLGDAFSRAATKAGPSGPSDWNAMWQIAGNDVETMAVLADLCKVSEASQAVPGQTPGGAGGGAPGGGGGFDGGGFGGRDFGPQQRGAVFGPRLIAFSPRGSVRLAQLGQSEDSSGAAAAEEPMLTGQINPNTASEAALLAFFGGQENADTLDIAGLVSGLIGQRDSQPLQSRGAFLLALSQTLGEGQDMRALFSAVADKVTVHSDSFEAHSFGLAPRTNIAIELRAQVDRSSGRCVLTRFRSAQ